MQSPIFRRLRDVYCLPTLTRRMVSVHAVANLKELKTITARTDWEKSLTHEDLQRLRAMQLKYEVWLTVDSQMPEIVSEREWAKLLKSNSLRKDLHLLQIDQRRRFQIEMNKVVHRQECKIKMDQRHAHMTALGSNAKMEYGKYANTITDAVRSYLVNRCHNYRVVAARRNAADSLKFAVDFSCGQTFCFGTRRIMAGMTDLFLRNMLHELPANLHFLGTAVAAAEYNEAAWRETMDWLERRFVISPEFYAHFTREPWSLPSDTDPSNVVYISSDASNVLMEVDPSKTYVVFPNSELQIQRTCFTELKRYKPNITVVRLPFDIYLKYQPSRYKSIRPSDVCGILLDMQLHGNWRKAILNNITELLNSHIRR